MAPSSNPDPSSTIDIGVNDLGPLAWVLDELRQSLDSATKALRRYVRDAELAKGSDLNAADASQLRIARQQLHQSVGALEMVGFSVPALMLRGMENAVQRFVTKPELCTEEAAAKVERASFALLGYLEALLLGKSPSAVELFSQYAQVQELAGATRIHPADLWVWPWQWRSVADTGVAAVELDAGFRARFDKAALQVVKTGHGPACAELAQLSAALANQSALAVDANFPIFWRIAAAAFEAVASEALVPDLHFKRTVSRLLIQLATHVKGDLSTPERLAQDLLFFCAQAVPRNMAPLLGEVRMAYGLAEHVSVDYSKSYYGQFDPTYLVQARKRIGQLKESWSSFSAGELSKAKPVQDQMSLLIDSIGRLLPSTGQSLAAALGEVVDSTARVQKAPEPTLGMEVATAILYLEASFEDFSPDDKQLSSRMAHLAQRLQLARGGAASQPLEPWMEELYRRVSDRQTMGSVVGELKLTLSELEKLMDAYFRDPQDKVLLSDVPSRLLQMRGVLTVLGLDQAAAAVTRMRESVENILVTELDVERARAAGTFDKLGNNLGALGFLIDMLSYQPVLAKKLFVFDESEGELKPLMGRHAPTSEAVETASAPTPAAAAPVSAAAPAAPAPASAPTSAPAAPVIVDAAEVDPELLDIFLEEAREVAGNGLSATEALVSEPNNIGEMTTLRRAFHTLKGSSRMVGLNVFGEAAWSMEQLMNAWLAEQRPATPALCDLSKQALGELQNWIEDIAKGEGKQRSASAFRASADAMRLQGAFEPLQAGAEALPAMAAPLAVAQPSVEPALTLPSITIPAVEAASSTVQLDSPAAEPPLPDMDFSLHLGDLDQGAAPSQEPDMLAFDLESVSSPKPVEASSPAASVLPGVADDLSFDMDFSVPASPAATPAAVEPEPANASLSGDGVSVQSDALVTADELAAFEQAMLAMDAAPAANSAQTLSAPPELVTVTADGGPNIAAIDFDALSTISIDTHKTALVEPSPQSPMIEEPEAPSFDFASTSTVPAALPDLPSAAEPADLGLDLGFELQDDPVPASSAAPLAPSDEQFKAVGPLRISLALYNVYLNEADEWSRRLSNVLSEWAMEPHAKLPGDSIAFAHSLAGSSATVGFTSLSDLARALENALQHMQRIEEDGDHDPHPQAPLFIQVAEEIRHLLHQFAAGFLKEGSPALEGQLAQCMLLPAPTEEPAAASLAQPDELIMAAALEQAEPEPVLAFAPAPEPLPEPEPEPVLLAQAEPEPAMASAPAAEAFISIEAPALVDETPAPTPEPAPVQAPVVALAQPTPSVALSEAPVLTVRSRQVGQDEIDDEIDAVDAIDPDLFEIFEEEAQELFPATASALRQWSARPENMSARAEVLRGLHTLKGSARLAGAMRLGELAHRMESSVESIPHEGAQSADIEPLMALLDGMQQNFEVLRNPALAAPSFASAPAPAPAFVSAQPAAESGTDASSGLATAGLGVAATAAALTGAAPLKPLMAAGASNLAPASPARSAPGQTVRVRAQLLDRLMNQAGEVMITRARLEAELSQLRGSLSDLTGNLEKMRQQLRELDVQAESQMQTRIQLAKETDEAFDPLEFDRYTRVQELTRMMAESVNDVATVQRNIQRTIESTEDDLIAQARQTRELQRDLLRTRMVEFEGISERLYRVVRQAGKDAGKQVKLDIIGGTIEMDRGVLDRMTPAFEHLLRNCVAHGIEAADERLSRGKAATGEIVITLNQEGNDVSLEFRDDGAGLNLPRIREKAVAQGLLSHDAEMADSDAANLIFTPGFSTAGQITELAGRGVGMDVVRSEVVALGGRIETSTATGQGTSFKLVLPLTTAVTQVVMVRVGELAIGIPANLVEIVRRATQKELQQAYNSGSFEYAGEALPFFWAGALLQHSAASSEPATKTLPVMIFRSAAQRVALHIDEVLGNQEVVVKNLGPQLSRLPGLAGMTVLASGAVALIYNPVALATVYGDQARAMSFDPAQPHALESQSHVPAAQGIVDAVPRELSADAAPVVPLVPANPASVSPPAVPLVLVVDDSITVRRVTQRLLQREGYRVSMAADGLQALERLAEELPAVILSDIEMPRMDGFDLLRNVRGNAQYKHLPTIMITSRIAEKHREHAFELGANHYLGKPYSEEELLSLIKRYAVEEATA
jgi:chemosensory pili system protein ChpA (sensor histidine kinase/response regulator)